MDSGDSDRQCLFKEVRSRCVSRLGPSMEPDRSMISMKVRGLGLGLGVRAFIRKLYLDSERGNFKPFGLIY